MIPADQAVEELIQKYGKLVFHTIYGMTGDWEESQDLTQDTFHQALKAIDAARTASGSQFREKAWLMSIALNTVRMQRRRRGLFRFIPFSHLQKGTQTTEKAYDTGIETLNERAAPVQPAGYGASESEDPADLIAERDAVQRTMGTDPSNATRVPVAFGYWQFLNQRNCTHARSARGGCTATSHASTETIPTAVCPGKWRTD